MTDPSGDMPQITLVVCTREREQSLERCLSSIWRAAPGQPHRPIDLIVVDNSQGRTAAPVVSSMRAHPTLRVRFLHEPAKGLSRARNAALKEASTPIIAFTDDDCCLHQGYFTGLAEAFSQISGPAVIGGRVDLGDPHDLAYTIRPGTRPETFHKRLVPGGFVIGCNFAFNRPALDSIGMFDPRFGAGGILRSAEDTDYVVRAVGAGVPVIYSPAFAVSHHHGRSSPEALSSVHADYNFGNGALYAKHMRSAPWLRRQFVWLVRGCLREALSGSRFDEGLGLSHFPILTTTIAGMRRYWSVRDTERTQ